MVGGQNNLLSWQKSFVDTMMQVAVGFGVPKAAVDMMRPQMESMVLQMNPDEVRASMVEVIERAQEIIAALSIDDTKHEPE